MEDIAWAAGLFEGEGTIFSADGGRPRLALCMTDKDVVDRFRDILGGTVSGPYREGQENRKLMYKWQEGKVGTVQSVLRQFWPYLGERRREQAALAFAKYYEEPIKRYKVRVA